MARKMRAKCATRPGSYLGLPRGRTKQTCREGQRGGGRQRVAVGVGPSIFGLQQLTFSSRDVRDRTKTVPVRRECRVKGSSVPPQRAPCKRYSPPSSS